MSNFRARLVKVPKLLNIVSNPFFLKALATSNVAAATEHLEAIRLTSAATLVDVGANKGQFSLAFRRIYPQAQIFAFEPLPDAADLYDDLFRSDRAVRLERVALAEASSNAKFFVTDRSDSSSLLRPGVAQATAFGVRADRTIRVEVKRLDECLSLPDLARPVLMKIDVQGAELKVLNGCGALEAADFIYVELSFVKLYDNQPLFGDVWAFLTTRGFSLAGVFNQVATPAYGPTQADFLFRRAEEPPPVRSRGAEA